MSKILKYVAMGTLVVYAFLVGLLGFLYVFFPAWSADLLREKFGYESVFWLERHVFSAQDGINQFSHSIFGESTTLSDENRAKIKIVATPIPMLAISTQPIESSPIGENHVLTDVPPTKMILPEIQSLEVPLNEGEGVWRIDDLPRTSEEDMPMAKASIRPDKDRTYALVQALLFDKRRIDLHMVGGTTSPGGDRNIKGPGLIPQEDRSNLLAAWNGGFQGIHGQNSMYADDFAGIKRFYRPLSKGLASVAVFGDGTIKIGEWGRDLTFSDDMVAVRQNVFLLVENGEISQRTNEGNLTWGFVNPNDTKTFITWRSAIGLTVNGDFIIASGNDLSADSFAHALWALGAHWAMQLDINRSYVVTSIYYNQPDGSLVAKKSMDQMLPNPGMFLSSKPLEKDFMYLTVHDLAP